MLKTREEHLTEKLTEMRSALEEQSDAKRAYLITMRIIELEMQLSAID